MLTLNIQDIKESDQLKEIVTKDEKPAYIYGEAGRKISFIKGDIDSQMKAMLEAKADYMRQYKRCRD